MQILGAALLARVNGFELRRGQARFANVVGVRSLINRDGYFYAGMPRNLTKETNAEIDRLRAVPGAEFDYNERYVRPH